MPGYCSFHLCKHARHLVLSSELPAQKSFELEREDAIVITHAFL